MSSPPLIIDRLSGHVLWLTLNRPEDCNALSKSMLCSLSERIERANTDDHVRVIVITGKGKVFSAGHNLKEMSGQIAGCEVDDAKRIDDILEQCTQSMMSLIRSPKPVIACVQGTASAAGCQLVAMCDLAITSKEAKFCAPGVNIGTFCTTPLVGIGRNIHRKHAMELALTGDMFSAEDAMRFGLVNRVVSAEMLEQETEQLAQKIASKSAIGIRSGKQAFYRQIEQPMEEAFRQAGKDMLQAMLSEECNEGINAFMEKRNPKWWGLE
ncbi:enoyl-CoA hydratase [Endozoicomonadaceae bacterium StTr2]